MFPNVKEKGVTFVISIQALRGDVCLFFFLTVWSILRPHKELLSLPLFSIHNVLRHSLSDMFPIYVIAAHLSNWQSLDSQNIVIVSQYQQSSSLSQDK